ncbi:MAG: hypothetical protein LQ349_009484 [Xanthoria aureola]|nr:MAG: hypothetical protein LQ349_009484 [Xanthoria aureola]
MAIRDSFTMDPEKKQAGISNVHPDNSNSNVVGETNELGVQGTERGFKARHAQMITIGGTIGTGFVVGSGLALSLGNPARFSFADISTNSASTMENLVQMYNALIHFA